MITLTPALEEQVNAIMEDMNFESPGEVLQLALQALLSQEQNRAEKKAAFNAELRRRLDAVDRGEVITMEEYRVHVDAKIAELRARSL